MGSQTQKQVMEQACVIPVRQASGGLSQVCLITSIRKKRWIFPKGIVDPGETLEQTGLKEAWEEAGLRGLIVGSVVGQFADRKWGAQLDVKVMTMEVTEAAEEWPEANLRQRRWCSIEESAELLHRNQLRRILAAAMASQPGKLPRQV